MGGNSEALLPHTGPVSPTETANLAGLGRLGLPLSLHCSPTQGLARDHYLSSWHLKRESECQEGSFPSRYKNKILLLQQDTVRKHRRMLMRRRRFKSVNEKFLRKPNTSSTAVSCICWVKNSIAGEMSDRVAVTYVARKIPQPCLCYRALKI